jgi:hypothetical protein
MEISSLNVQAPAGAWDAGDLRIENCVPISNAIIAILARLIFTDFMACLISCKVDSSSITTPRLKLNKRNGLGGTIFTRRIYGWRIGGWAAEVEEGWIVNLTFPKRPAMVGVIMLIYVATTE